MDDTVPYEGYGDANNHSETLNKTLHHAMLVRTHTFTAHHTAHTFTATAPRDAGEREASRCSG